ncbi:MAG: ATP-binding protein [Phycisphaerae bacterium]|nr:ATP-binding protein [Phycisphaerae bacterium]
MKTIRAKVNERLLQKASRLFNGTLEGRVIEILQNARRAGATEVHITNQDGLVTVRDNGNGIGDFSKLLDLGGTGWDDDCDVSEDPAGVGIFCLAPREVTIRSNGKMVVIRENGWTGTPIEIIDDPEHVGGTVLQFRDDPWDSAAVDRNAVFTGLRVTADSRQCPSMPFVSDAATHHSELGCRIEVRPSEQLNPWHHSAKRERWMCTNVLVNFHGQVVAFDDHPVSVQRLHYLVDLTGEPTGIRLMLPARTCLIENEALDLLKSALELEAFRFVERQSEHELPYKEYLRAHELGIKLPEAKPVYLIGLLSSDEPPEPVEVQVPKGFPLQRCYRFDADRAKEDSDEANVHLLAALGSHETPFVPVEIRKAYDGYSWAMIGRIENVGVQVGKVLHEDSVWSEWLVCVESIRITARTSDGSVFESPVCMGLLPGDEQNQWSSNYKVCVTPEARERLMASEIWHHLGGWCEDGDTYDTQAEQVEQELDRFWRDMVGPDEHLRAALLDATYRITPEWQVVTITSNGTVDIQFADGTTKAIQPPPATPS